MGTIGAKKGGRRVEITTHRAEPYMPNSRKPEVKFGDEIEADLARRDFTVNAMVLALPEPRLIDPFEGAVPRGEALAHPAGAGGVVLRGSAPQDARGAVHRALRPRAGRRDS